jgi:hypothetical protein
LGLLVIVRQRGRRATTFRYFPPRPHPSSSPPDPPIKAASLPEVPIGRVAAPSAPFRRRMVRRRGRCFDCDRHRGWLSHRGSDLLRQPLNSHNLRFNQLWKRYWKLLQNAGPPPRPAHDQPAAPGRPSTASVGETLWRRAAGERNSDPANPGASSLGVSFWR